MSDHQLLNADIEYQGHGFVLKAAFTLRSGWTVLFGASGAGKTTLLRILAGLTQPARATIALNGNVLVDGDRAISFPAGKRKIGFVPQQTALFPHLTVTQNVAFGLHGRNNAARERRVHELMTLFALKALADRKPRQLSGGERQRVALAQALAPKPTLLLLDEPFNALDLAARAMAVKTLRSTGVPVLYVSHDLADAWQINADALLLEAGQITAHGETHTILSSQRQRLLDQLGV